MGDFLVQERFAWFDSQVRRAKYPNASHLVKRFEISPKTARSTIGFLRDRMLAPLVYDSSRNMQHYMANWVLIAFCHNRSDWRKFFLSRMVALETLKKSFGQRPAREWQPLLEDAFGILQGPEKVKVTFRFTPFRARWIKEQHWHPEQEMNLIVHRSWRNRKTEEGDPRNNVQPGFRMNVHFTNPVRGPLVLGDSAHFGLGLFVPSRRETC
ncbi:MAG: WYL domain-containing protein [Thermodesulfobacteriota bacterium]